VEAPGSEQSRHTALASPQRKQGFGPIAVRE
jgi:hypothetical protein